MSERTSTVAISSNSAGRRRLAATRALSAALHAADRWAEADQAVFDTPVQELADPVAGGELAELVHVVGRPRPGRPGRFGSSSPPRALAMRAMLLVNHGYERELVVRVATQVLETADASDAGAAWYALLALVYADELVPAREYTERAIARQPVDAPRWHQCALALLRARIAWRGGDLRAGYAGLDRLLANSIHLRLLGLAVAWMVTILVELGDLDRARDLLGRHNLAGSLSGAADRAELFAARGALYRASGQPRAAREEYLRCGAELTAASVVNPAVLSWRAPAALCARELRWDGMAVALAQEELIEARRWGARRTHGQALHAVAMVDADNDVELLTSAVELLRAPTTRRELTSAQYELGIRLNARRQYERGTRALRAARRAAASIGSAGWQRRIDSAERCWRPGGGARELKPRETAIALLARAGLSNREIGGRVHLTDRTVEFHLSNVYRKLGIAGRDQLRSVALPSV